MAKTKVVFEDLVQSNPSHPAVVLAKLTEDGGGKTERATGYEGIKLFNAEGKNFALIKQISATSCSLYLHNTTVEGTQSFMRENAPELESKIVLDKKGYPAARLTGIESASPELLALVRSCVVAGETERKATRTAQVEARRAEKAQAKAA